MDESQNKQASDGLKISRRSFVAGGAALAALVAAGCRTTPDTTPNSTQDTTGAQGATVTTGQAQAALGQSSPLSEEVKLRHLLRRAGFGANPTELADYRKLGLQGTVDRLLNYDQVDNTDLEDRLKKLNLNMLQRPEIQRWWLLRMAYTARPLEEKMTLFWHGLLTSSFSKARLPNLMRDQNEFFRKNALGRFPDILQGISRDPAMMLWLDLNQNLKSHPNENYARELMELFSLGIGNYTEQDVREAARAYTGWSYRPLLGFTFNSNQHDAGSKTFLGQTGNFDGDNVVDVIMRQPASPRFIAGKLFSFFAYPNPSAEVLGPLVDAYKGNDLSIKALVRAILTSDEFYSAKAYRAIVKSPIEFVAGTLRTLGIDNDGKQLAPAAISMGQEPFNPPNVAGWPGGRTWLASGTWLARVNFANRLAAAIPEANRPEAGALAGAASATAPADAVDKLLDLFLDGQSSPDGRQALIDYITPPGGGSLAGADKSWVEERRRGLAYLVLASPEYQLN